MPHRRRYDRTPDAVALLGLAVVAGLAQVGTGKYPGSVMDLVPWPWALVWAVSLTASAALALTGILWPRSAVLGWGIELAGRVGVFFTAGAYLYAFGRSADTAGALLVAFVAALTLASLVRVMQLTRRLRDSFATIERRIMSA